MMIQPGEYLSRYRRCQILQTKQIQVESRVERILTSQSTYKIAEEDAQVPWFVIACIHSLESSLNFRCHLHNGDPLETRTVHVPRGRPLADPWHGLPYSWVQSAADALSDRWRPAEWNLAGVLEFLERYNGLGYRAYCVNSPYLWSCTDQYTRGLFVFDGRFSPNIVSDGIGAAALLKALEAKGSVQLS